MKRTNNISQDSSLNLNSDYENLSVNINIISLKKPKQKNMTGKKESEDSLSV